MSVEDMKAAARLAGMGVALAHSAIEQVLAGQEPGSDRWQVAAREYETLVAKLDGHAAPAMPPPVRALGLLASVVVERDLDRAADLAAEIPEIPDFNLVRLMGAAIVAQRRAKALGASRPEALSDLAKSLYAMLPFAGSREQSGEVLSRIAQTYRTAVEGLARQGDWEGAVGPCVMFVAMANEAATHFRNLQHLPDALTWGERLIAAHPAPQDNAGLGMCVLANNLINTCSALARESPSPAEFFEKQVAFARYGNNLCRSLHPDAERAATLLPVHENMIRGLVFGELNLALARPEAFSRHAAAAWAYCQEYEGFASNVDDPDVRQRCGELGRQLQHRLRREKPDWAPPHAGESEPEPPDAEALARRLQDRLAQAGAEAERIRMLADPQSQRRALEEAAGAVYRDIATSLAAVMDEIGLNHHVCRYLAMLGAIASGRLGPLASDAVALWAMQVTDMAEGPLSHRRQIQRRQQLPAVNHLREEMAVAECLSRLAELTQCRRFSAELGEWVDSFLQQQNARLLASLLPRWARVQFAEHRKQPAANDLAAMLGSAPGECAQAARDEYRRWAGPGSL